MNSPEAIIKELLDSSGMAYSSVEKEVLAGQEIYSIRTDDARTLIGGHGDTIHAIDLLVKKIYERRNPPPEGADADEKHGGALFLVDVNDYRTKQIKELQTKAFMMAERARSFQYDVELSPMTAYERLIVHTTLHDAPHIKTESQGEGRNRRVVIKYAAD